MLLHLVALAALASVRCASSVSVQSVPSSLPPYKYHHHRPSSLSPLKSSSTPLAFSLAPTISSHMVLQAEAPAVYGRGVPGATVTVSVVGSRQGEGVHSEAAGEQKKKVTGTEAMTETEETLNATVASDGWWRALLAPRNASDPTSTGVTIAFHAVYNNNSSSGNGRNQNETESSWSDSIVDVLFGDVWVCSGQSNVSKVIMAKGDKNSLYLPSLCSPSSFHLPIFF